MVRFLADANLRHAIVIGCARREPAIDFLSAHAANLHGVSDPDVLAMAAAQGRILITHDFRTMPKHFAEFLAAGGSSSFNDFDVLLDFQPLRPTAPPRPQREVTHFPLHASWAST